MMKASNVKIILAMVGIFVAGAVVGGLATDAWRKHTRARFTAREFSERHFQRMVDYLELTDEQVERIRPMMTEFADQIKGVRRESFGEIREIFDQMNSHLVAELTPEQLVLHRQMMDRMRARFERAAKRRGDDWHPPGDRPPPEPAPSNDSDRTDLEKPPED